MHEVDDEKHKVDYTYETESSFHEAYMKLTLGFT